MENEDIDFFSVNTYYLDPLRLFYACYNQVPSAIEIPLVNLDRAFNWFEKMYQHEIVEVHRNECYRVCNKKMERDHAFYILKKEMIVYRGLDIMRILYVNSLKEDAEALFKNLLPFIKKPEKRTSAISLVIQGSGDLSISNIKIRKPTIDLQSHYNTDLVPVHKKILKTLRRKDKSGLILFHGIPGTGKSTYIRYLIHQQSKPVLFIPPGLASHMDSPMFTSFLIKNKNTIFVIEDAEELLVARDSRQKPPISMLLNITDGLLGECLGIQVIATFNTAIANIDTALLRKGRLIARYEFKHLEQNKTSFLLEKLGMESLILMSPMTIGDIYHAKEENFQKVAEDRKIGFGLTSPSLINRG